MKKDTHPKWFPNAKVLVNGELVMNVGSTRPEIHVEIWSGTHPFYTGQQRLVDTEGQVDRFMRRLQRRETIRSEKEAAAEARSPLAVAIDGLGFGTRAEKALREAGLTNVGDLLNKLKEGDDALLAIPGVGQKALIDAKRYLRNEGLM